MKVWLLFSIVNDYDQPENNLEAWWKDKPSFDTLAKAVGIMVDKKKGNEKIGRILKGEDVRISGADYRLQELEEGKLKQNYY